MDTKIYLLSRCVERKYAELMFYKGILHFSQPAKWIEEAKKGNVGQGDLLEGVYSNEINAKTLSKGQGDRHLSHTKSKGILSGTFSVFGYYNRCMMEDGRWKMEDDDIVFGKKIGISI